MSKHWKHPKNNRTSRAWESMRDDMIERYLQTSTTHPDDVIGALCNVACASAVLWSKAITILIYSRPIAYGEELNAEAHIDQELGRIRAVLVEQVEMQAESMRKEMN